MVPRPRLPSAYQKIHIFLFYGAEKVRKQRKMGGETTAFRGSSSSTLHTLTRHYIISPTTHNYLSNRPHYPKMDPTLSSDDGILPSKIVVKNITTEHGEDAGEELDKSKEGTMLRWSLFALSAIMMWCVHNTEAELYNRMSNSHISSQELLSECAIVHLRLSKAFPRLSGRIVHADSSLDAPREHSDCPPVHARAASHEVARLQRSHPPLCSHLLHICYRLHYWIIHRPDLGHAVEHNLCCHRVRCRRPVLVRACSL